jgi:hypothetical protein
MIKQHRLLAWPAVVLLAVGCLLSEGAHAAPPGNIDEVPATSTRGAGDDEAALSGTHVEGEVEDPPMLIGRPGSIPSRLRRDRIPKEYLFQFLGVSRALKPWYDFKADLDKNHGFRFGISYAALYQKANEAFGPEDDAAGYDLDIIGTWTFLGRGTTSPTKLGFEFFRRDDLGTELPPQRLFTQYGALYSNAAPYGEEDLVIGELWIHQKIRNRFGFRIGKIFPVTAYDYFPFKNFRLDFIDFNHVTNATIPLPGYGLGAFAVYRPLPNFMVRLGVHDANADVQESGFDTYEKGEHFKILEVGYDTSLIPRKIGRPPQSTIHVSL